MAQFDLNPADNFSKEVSKAEILLLACGALAREIVHLTENQRSPVFAIQCLPAKWHNTPQFIVPALREKIRENKTSYRKVFVLYGDCGTGGLLDQMLAEEGVERIAGPHCYSFYSGNAEFAATAEQDMTSFFLTDYLVRHFDKLMWEGLGLDRHPELLNDYFGNYTKLIYLAQTEDQALQAKAKDAAGQLGLNYEYRFTGYGELATDIAHLAVTPAHP